MDNNDTDDDLPPPNQGTPQGSNERYVAVQ